MTEVPVADDDVRVGDDERRAVDERLHRAVGAGQLTLGEYDERARDVWAARTRGELAAVVRDLPGAAPAVPAPPAGTRRAVAVMGEERLSGTVAPGQGVEGYAVMGSARLDLSRDDLPAHVRVRAVAVMGEVEVLVPEGATVELSGASVMGDRSVRLGQAVAGAPVVHLSALAVMGSVKVRSAGMPTGAARVVAAVTAALPAQRASAEPVPRRRRHRAGWCVAGLGLAGLLGAGLLAPAASVQSVSVPAVQVELGPGSDERVDLVPASAATYTVQPWDGDVVVVVPDGRQVQVRDLRTAPGEEVDCDEACEPVGTPLVLEVPDGVVGGVEVETASEHDD